MTFWPQNDVPAANNRSDLSQRSLRFPLNNRNPAAGPNPVTDAAGSASLLPAISRLERLRFTKAVSEARDAITPTPRLIRSRP